MTEKHRAKISLREQADEAHRELVMRHRVYPGLIKRGKMTEAEAEAGYAVMRAIRDTLALFAEHEDAVRGVLMRERKTKDLFAEVEQLRKTEPALDAVLETFPGATVAGITDRAPGGADDHFTPSEPEGVEP